MIAETARALRLTLGPLLYYWPRDTVFAFYEEAAAWPVDSVYLGETVCGKRHELRPEDWRAIARKLADAGKEVVMSTCELIESEQDLRVMRKVCDNGEFLVEANDIGAVKLASAAGRFVAGPYLNLYSRPSLEVVREMGAVRWVAPLEVSREGLRGILEDEGGEIETEVFAHGRLPLAVSARCFTARYNNVTKDDCGWKCLEHPDGLVVATQDDEPFLAMNGLQTQSARVHDLAAELPAMAAMGVNLARISPQSRHTADIVRAFRDVADGRLAPAEATRALSGWAPASLCDGYWHGRPGLERAGRVLLPGARP